MFMRQPRSPPSRVSAPDSSIERILSSTIFSEIAGYSDTKLPPKPQHTSASSISDTASPLTPDSSSRGWVLMPSWRRPLQESW